VITSGLTIREQHGGAERNLQPLIPGQPRASGLQRQGKQIHKESTKMASEMKRKRLITLGVLLGPAFAVRFWLPPAIMIHFTYWAVPVNVVGFWFLLLLSLILLVRLLIGAPTFWKARIQRKQRVMVVERRSLFRCLGFTAVPSSIQGRQPNLRLPRSSSPKLRLPVSPEDLSCSPWR
jgi:hypothetical protein